MARAAIRSRAGSRRSTFLCRAAIALAASLFFFTSGADLAAAATRRAFLVGIQRYSDGYIQRLERAADDARDLAKDLEEVGFDKKNIKVAVDLSTRESFEKQFDAFLNTVQPGDEVFFFFSGHGFGVEAEQTNYLLFTDLKSPFTYTKQQLPDADRKNPDVVRLKIPQYLDAYQANEIPKGISANEIQRRISEKNPKTVIMILDACRSLVQTDISDSQEIKLYKRGNESGSRLLSVRKPPSGFLILFSASFGEQAVQTLGPADLGRNSLFTAALRSELQRPGQSAIELGERLKLMVRSIANDHGRQQDPEIFFDREHSASLDEFYLVAPIGRDRFRMIDDKCAGEEADWNQVKELRKRELYERHIRRFDLCGRGTAELARRAIGDLALDSDDPIFVQASQDKSINDCDKLAASPLDRDRARPPGTGVLTQNLDPDLAIPACNRAISENRNITRYLYNLGRAYQKLAKRPSLSEAERRSARDHARIAYEDAVKRGYVSALNNLAELYEWGDKNYDVAVDFFKRSAQQGDPLAMYNLAIHYRDGKGIERDDVQAAEWFARSAGAGLLSAKVEYGIMLKNGRGQPNSLPNIRRATEQLKDAARSGSVRAMYELGSIYKRQRDDQLALIWYARAAEGGDTNAQVEVAKIMEEGKGLTAPQPEIAQFYWRVSAQHGDAYAQVEFAEKLRKGLLLVKEEYGEHEVVSLLRQAMSQGSAHAAVALAQIYREGELGLDKDPLLAMKLAYHAIDLATLAEPTTAEGNPYYEFNAAHFLIEMAKNGEAIDAAGRPLLTPDEIDRLERYYGTVDPITKRIKVRAFKIPIFCLPRYYLPEEIWVWDWGRSEAPTESQIRFWEGMTGCSYNKELRATLASIYNQAKKSNVAFADLLSQRIQTLEGQRVDTQEKRKDRRRGRN